MKKLGLLFALALSVLAAGCSESKPPTKAVYMLLDTSGTYTQQIQKAQGIVRYLLGTLTSGDSLALARIDSGSFSEKDIVAKITFDLRPSKANSQKRAFLEAVDQFAKEVKGSSYTDITGGMLQAIEYLNETGAGHKYILVFSDMEEDIQKGQVRDFPITFGDIKVVALNVTKLRSDNVDPREYMKRVEHWEKRVVDGGGSWRVINDLDRLDSLLQ